MKTLKFSCTRKLETLNNTTANFNLTESCCILVDSLLKLFLRIRILSTNSYWKE